MPYKLNKELFIKKSKEVHGSTYEYDDVIYVNNKSPVDIYCKKHGIFTQRANDHMAGRGCPMCACTRLTTETFIDKATIVHCNRYDYSRVDYKSSHEKITIICKDHGEFSQRATNHLMRRGCPRCSNNGYSRISIEWLVGIMEHDGIHIQHAENGGEFKIPGTPYYSDGFCAETNTIFEFHGDAWHGNPLVYKKNDICHPRNKNITAGELYQNTIDRDSYIAGLGYQYVVMWENEYYQNKKNNIIINNYITNN